MTHLIGGQGLRENGAGGRGDLTNSEHGPHNLTAGLHVTESGILNLLSRAVLAQCQWPLLAKEGQSLIITSPPTETAPAPSCWRLRSQWPGPGSAGGTCPGWLASKSHRLEWAEKERMEKVS